MNFSINPMWLPTLLLAIALCGLGFRFAARPASRGLRKAALALAVAASAPGLLMALYYAHLFDRALWFYEFRAVPYSELSATGLGWAGGVVLGTLWRGPLRSGSKSFAWIMTGLVLFCLTGLLLAPYAKSVIAPLRTAMLDRWTNGVCLQTTPSTCGAASAATLLRRFGRAATEQELARECFTYGSGTENWYLVRALRSRGLQVRMVLSSPRSASLPFPCIAGTEYGGRGGSGHFITLLGQQNGRMLVGDPIGGPSLLTPEEIRYRYYLTGFFLVATDPLHTPAAPRLF
jgi:hypothetical protein